MAAVSGGATERKLAAILAADVVGFSRQMGADEAGNLARISALRTDVLEPLLAQHCGRLFKTMGDGFLAEFASVVQAVACAVAVQARLAEQDDGLRLRIGVHSGDVVVPRDDGNLDDVFDLQDQVTGSVVAAIAPRVCAGR